MQRHFGRSNCRSLRKVNALFGHAAWGHTQADAVRGLTAYSWFCCIRSLDIISKTVATTFRHARKKGTVKMESQFGKRAAKLGAKLDTTWPPISEETRRANQKSNIIVMVIVVAVIVIVGFFKPKSDTELREMVACAHAGAYRNGVDNADWWCRAAYDLYYQRTGK